MLDIHQVWAPFFLVCVYVVCLDTKKLEVIITKLHTWKKVAKWLIGFFMNVF